MKILITGSTGLLGQALSRRLAPSCDLVGLSRSTPSGAVAGGHVACDLTDAGRTHALLRELQPGVVIHAQALSDVDQCELEPQRAWEQNVRTVSNLLEACEPIGGIFLYVSTDYVFDGAKGAPYDETDQPNPINVYGRSKLEGEHVALSSPAAVVIRVSTLFGPARMNFCDHAVSQLKAGRPVEAFSDQVTSPTYTHDVAEGIEELLTAIRRSPMTSLPSRVVHMTNAVGCSRLEFSQRIAALLGVSRANIRPIRMAEQKRAAPRPGYSALTTRYLPHLIGRRLRPWEEALEAYLRESHSFRPCATGAR